MCFFRVSPVARVGDMPTACSFAKGSMHMRGARYKGRVLLTWTPKLMGTYKNYIVAYKCIMFTKHLGTNFSFYLIIFPSTYDGKIQWSTSGIKNVADFCHFVT